MASETQISLREKIQTWGEVCEDITQDDLLTLIDDRDFLRDVIRELKSKVVPHSDKAIYFGKVLEKSILLSGD